jgi:hypothetical protein
MARQDFGKRDRDDDRYGRTGEEYWNREDDQDDMEERRRRREFQPQNREYGREQDREHRGGQWGERRYGGGNQGMEERERYQSGYGDRGWETSGMGGPRTYGEGSYRRSGGMFGAGMGQNYGESGTYGGSSMYGGGFGAGMMGEGTDWRRGDPYGNARQRGRFFGRGPKGYRRSDDRIREDVNERLFRHNEVDAGEVEVEVREGTVTLSGTVDSHDERRMAEDCVWDVTGVQHLSNMIRVEPNRAGNGEEWQRGRQPSGREGQTTQQISQTRNKKNR